MEDGSSTCSMLTGCPSAKGFRIPSDRLSSFGQTTIYGAGITSTATSPPSSRSASSDKPLKSASQFASSSASPGAHASRRAEGLVGCDIGLLQDDANPEMRIICCVFA
ncbi:hypothetical protein PC116_g23162 [Phytophthora cactorum]|nr:hypothetical protein PC114_g20908 [Phytophthora cactorum]KAG2905753.1 hypothetical protein PC117_g20676 [Phytophthora cactorum]KAG2967106.1 hypothetical protein PC118_g18785 [Phytophthora cactorum]KAG3156892.1 hypothetical protein PC128_g21775 [Phytophthora cactorum]KAG4228482.1 hypothetical protein PC116_g23162 [Phytophthora cactorum]